MSATDPLAALRPLVDDWHTHTPRPRAIVNLPSPAAPAPDGLLCSIGLHPWDTTGGPDDLRTLEEIEARAAADPAIAAIGECGLDRLRGASLDIQIPLFRRQAEMAGRLGKPLIIHCVRAYPEILRLHKELRPDVPWIFHGFRANAQTAAQILARPLTFISVGPDAPASLTASIPPGRLLHETD